MENQAQSVVSPNVIFLTDVLDNISTGELRIPNFQRPYVWKPADAISLFDSINKGYPIGSVLFWETTEELLSFTKIGPFEVSLEKRPVLNYVIDGHQRLGTLFGVLKSKKNLKSYQEDRWGLLYNLDKGEFFYRSNSTKVPNYIRMDKIINAIDFLDECKRIQDENPTRADIYIGRAQKLSQSIVSYKLPVTQIKKGDLSSAVEIFSRLNTKGMDITPDQMLSALTYKEGGESFKLADRIDDILARLVEFDFSEVERVFIFRSIIAAAKRDIYSVKLEDLARDKHINLPEVVDGCELSVVKAVEFLKTKVHVPSDKFLPYNLQLVFLSELFFTNPNPSEEQLQEMIKWFWFTSYSGWFAGANSSKVKKGLENVRSFAQGFASTILNESEYDASTVPIPAKFDFRFARIKAFVLFLLSLEPKTLDADANPLQDILKDSASKALHTIVSLDPYSFANKMIIGPVRLGYAKMEISENINSISSSTLASHGITEDAAKSLISGNYSKFLQIRRERLLELEKKFVGDFGLTYNSFEDRVSNDQNQFELFDVVD